MLSPYDLLCPFFSVRFLKDADKEGLKLLSDIKYAKNL